jgi:NAD-dependent dihydropyrimidine dehydrogenase PreA subunit
LVDGKAVIDPDKCDLDGICIAACPQHAIHFSD